MNRVLMYAVVALVPLLVFGQTILEEKPTAPPEYIEPGFYEYSWSDFPMSIRSTNQNIYSGESYDISDCIRDRYVSPTYSYNGCDSLPYLLLPPKDTAGGQLFPLVVDLHGAGGIGSSPTDLTGITRNLAQDTMRAMYPCYGVAARLPERSSENTETDYYHPLYRPDGTGNYPLRTPMIDIYIEMIEDLIAKYPIDPDRIYVTGHSHGGHGTRLLMTERPDLFAAGAPASASPILFDGAPEIIGDNIPVWQFGGVDDATVSQLGLESSYDSLLFYGALDNIFWYRHDAGHSDDRPNIRELVDWLFSQNKQDYASRPVADLALTGASEGFAPIAVSFDGSGSSAQGAATITSHEWQIATSLQGLDTTSITFSATSGNYTFTEPGSYFIRLIVTDSDGRRRAKVEKVFIYDPNPEASFIFNRNYETVNKDITFDASASLPVQTETISSYAWDFGDGNTAGGEKVTHAYSAAGSYSCRLIVSSSGGAKDTLIHPVEVTTSFPGYQIFTFEGFDVNNDQLWRGNSSVYTLKYMEGSDIYPVESLTSDNMGDYAVSASSAATDNDAYKAFDGDDATKWKPLPHRFPSTLTLDLGVGNSITPTGMYLFQEEEYGVQFNDYTILASVDGLMWDTIYEHKEDMGGTEPDISFPDFPYIEITNPLSGDTAGQGSVIELQSALFNISTPSEVRYYVDGSYVGSSSTSPEFLYEWTASLAEGTHSITSKAVFNGTADTIISKSIDFSIESPGVLTTIEVSPGGVVLSPGATQQYTAVAKDQYGNLVNPQSVFTWSVSTGAGSISTDGLYTAGSLYGEFDIIATATEGATTVNGSEKVLLPNPDDLCADYFPGTTLNANWDTIDLDNYAGSVVSVNDGVLTLEGRGSGVWGSTNEYFGIVRSDLTGDFDVSVKVLSQSYSHDNARAGIIVANNFDNLSEGGYAEVYSRPSGAYRFQYDGSGAIGEISTTSGSISGGVFPVWFRLQKVGTDFTAYYKTDESASWTSLGTVSPQATSANSQVAIFMNSNDAGVTGIAEFAEFKVANCVSGPSISISAPADKAEFNENDNITLQSSIVNMAETVDKVIYFANGSVLGESTTADTYDYAWNSVPSGAYDLTAMAVYNSTADTIISAPVAITVLAPPVFSTIDITPENAVVLEGETETYSAIAKDQFGDPIDPQPTFIWISTGGSINTSGVYSAGATAGDYFAYAEADVDGVIIKDSVAVEVQELEFSIAISPASTTVLTEGTVQYDAIVENQFGDAIAMQPTFTWSVSGGGTIGTDGLFTAGTVSNDYQVYAEATVASELLKDSVTVTVTDDPGACLVTFENPLDAAWDTLINCEDGSGSVYIDEATDKLVVNANNAACNSFYGTRDFFNGIIAPAVSGDFEVAVKVEIQADGWESGSRAGIVIGRNLSPTGPGVASVVVRPQSNEYRLYYDSNEDGEMDDWINPGSGLHNGVSTWVRIVRTGADVTAYYKNEGDVAWTDFGTRTIGFAGQEMQIGLASAQVNVHFDSLSMSTCPLVTGGATKQDQTISFDPIPDKVTTDAPFTVTATASSGLDVSLSVLSGPASISDHEVTLTGDAGEVSIQATQAGDDYYEAATPVVQSFTVSVVSSQLNSHADRLQIFPNPVQEKLTLSYRSGIESVHIFSLQGVLLEVYDVCGQQSADLDVSSLPNGLYFLKVIQPNGESLVHRIVIQK